MKTILLWAVLVSGLVALRGEAASMFDDGAPDYYSRKARQATHAIIAETIARDGNSAEGIRVDREWVEQFAEVLGRAVYQRSAHVLALSNPIVFRVEDGTEFLEVQLLGRIVRLNSIDYNLGEKVGRELAQLVESARSRAALRDAASRK